MLAPYLAGATETAREIYSSWAGDRDLAAGDRSWAGDRDLAEASRQEDARRTRTSFFEP